VGELAGADGDDGAFLWLFLGGIGNDETAGRHLFLGAGPDDHAVADGLDLAGHVGVPSLKDSESAANGADVLPLGGCACLRYLWAALRTASSLSGKRRD